MVDDWQLLRRFGCEEDQNAFTELVNRHLGFVYSAAFRQSGDRALAEDIAQMVFANLASRARALKQHGTLAGWLHRDTRFTTLEVLRRERRRMSREQSAIAMHENEPELPPDSLSLQSVLDPALARLDQLDRDALLLRYLQQRSLKEVGAELGLNEDAVRKRIARALDRLRQLLAKAGVTTTSEAISAGLIHTAQPLPAGLAATIITSSLAVAPALTAGITTWNLTELLAMTKLKATAAAAILVTGIATPLVVQHNVIGTLREKNRNLAAQTSQMADLRLELDRLVQQGAEKVAVPQLADNERAELLQLRNEVALLRRQTNEMAAAERQTGRTRPAAPVREPLPDAVATVAEARKIIFDANSGAAAKLAALSTLRSVNARTDDVVKQMVALYYETAEPAVRADIFRQLSGVTTADLKRALLDAVSSDKSHARVREEAAETLAGYVSDPDVKAWLEHLAGSDSDEKVRAQAADSLQRLVARK